VSLFSQVMALLTRQQKAMFLLCCITVVLLSMVLGASLIVVLTHGWHEYFHVGAN
jgi:hypothetical protein